MLAQVCSPLPNAEGQPASVSILDTGNLSVNTPYTLLERTKPDDKMAIKTLTFGCRLNAYETEVMRDKATAAELDALERDAILVNTCAVTSWPSTARR